MRMFPRTHTDTFADAFPHTFFTSAHCYVYVRTHPRTHADSSQAYTQRQTRKLRCVKLWTLVSGYVSNCRCRRWIPIFCRCLWTRMLFLAEAKIFASTHLSSAAAGISRDGCRLQPPLSWPGCAIKLQRTTYEVVACL